MIKILKRLIDKYKGDRCEDRCECGGKLTFKYVGEVGNIDEDYFANQYLSKCRKCNKETIIEYDVET